MKTACNRKIHSSVVLLVLASILITRSPASNIRIDGSFEDWKDARIIARDPRGDAKGAFDVSRVFAASQGSILYLRFDTGSNLNLQNGPQGEGTLLVAIDLPDGRRLILDTRGRRAYLNDGLKERIPWAHLKYVVGPTYAQDEFEIQIDLGRFDTGPGDSVRIQFDGSDRLDVPATYTFSGLLTEPEHRSFRRNPGTDVRIVSLNTYVEGLILVPAIRCAFNLTVPIGSMSRQPIPFPGS